MREKVLEFMLLLYIKAVAMLKSAEWKEKIFRRNMFYETIKLYHLQTQAIKQHSFNQGDKAFLFQIKWKLKVQISN